MQGWMTGIRDLYWVPSALRDANWRLLAEYRPSQVADIVVNEQDDEDKITIEIQRMHKVTRTPWRQILKLDNFQEGESTDRALATDIIRYRRALRSHSDLLGKMVEKYQEARIVGTHLKGIIEGEDSVGGANVLHFDMLQVPERDHCHLTLE